MTAEALAAAQQSIVAKRFDEALRDLERLVDDHTGRSVRIHQLVDGDAQHVAVHGGHAEQLPVDRVLFDQRVDLRARDEELRTEGTGDDAEAGRLNAQVASMRPELEAMEQQRRQRAEALSEAENRISALESELAVLREKVDSGGRRQGEIAGEVERSRQRRGEIEGEHAEASRELEDLRHVLRERQAVVEEREEIAREFNERFENTRSMLGKAQQLSLGFLIR